MELGPSRRVSDVRGPAARSGSEDGSKGCVRRGGANKDGESAGGGRYDKDTEAHSAGGGRWTKTDNVTLQVAAGATDTKARGLLGALQLRASCAAAAGVVRSSGGLHSLQPVMVEFVTSMGVSSWFEMLG